MIPDWGLSSRFGEIALDETSVDNLCSSQRFQWVLVWRAVEEDFVFFFLSVRREKGVILVLLSGFRSRDIGNKLYYFTEYPKREPTIIPVFRENLAFAKIRLSPRVLRHAPQARRARRPLRVS